ncbi:hypothetical protein UG54_01295 [Gordonia sihwensis]|nr:hypothetical protein UG54_01295 [Gordonia sihwensis]
MQLRIANCPDDQARAILEIIDAHDLSVDIDDRPNVLRIGEIYRIDEIPCKTSEEIANELQEVAPDASWECWEDPKYEWLGDLYRFTPELGLFTVECGGEGEPLFTAFEVRHFMAKATAVGGVDLARSLGELHEQALIEKIEQATAESSNLTVPTQD